MVTENIDDIRYEVISESEDGKTRQFYWELAIGLNKVDGLEPSKYFLELVDDNIQGKCSYKEVGTKVRKYYKDKDKNEDETDSSEMECDLVASRIYEMMIDDSFSFNPALLRTIHYELFQDVYDHAGKYKDANRYKNEPTLNDGTVVYGDYRHIDIELEKEFNKEEITNYRILSDKERAMNVADFMSRIWKIHPFAEGNTRTCSVFIGKYLRSMGYEISNKSFHENSLYLRCALVRANYKVPNQDFWGDSSYLYKFFENLMYNTKHILDIRDTVVKETFALATGGYEYSYEEIFEDKVLYENEKRIQRSIETKEAASYKNVHE